MADQVERRENGDVTDPGFPDPRECCLIVMVPRPHWHQDATLLLDDIRPEEAARVLRSFADRLEASAHAD